MNTAISTIWTNRMPDRTGDKIQEILRSTSPGGKKLKVFFRADDIAHPDECFERLMHTFLSHGIPLCLAVVPDWLDSPSWRTMIQFNPESPLWCWHQHGRSHVNHEQEGKKCEFGDSRAREAISRDLAEGRERLFSVMGELFYPVFTPPWNRCGLTTLELLREQGFKGVSRWENAIPSALGILPDLAVNVDLHTRRELNFTEGWRNLLAEFSRAAERGLIGVMLHHQRMNEEAFAFLELLLTELGRGQQVSCCTFRELVQSP